MIKDAYRSCTGKWRLAGFILLVCTLLSIILAMPAEALRLKTNWAGRANLSEKIIRGQVIDVRSYWDYNKNLIYTDVTILVDEHIKGNGSREISITLPGGTIGDQTHQVSDTPQFAVGDYGVICLEPSGQVTGGPDGVHLLLAEDRFLSWIKAYLTGQTKISFEEVPEGPSDVLMQQDISNATISGVSPSTISAGTGNSIIIRGRGFGASRGSGNFPAIAFRYKNQNYMYSNSKIISWSDTQIQAEVWTGIVNNYNYSPGSWADTVAFVNNSGVGESFWPLTITFGYGRAKWATSQVPYYINATGGPSGSSSALQNAAGTWNGAGANFSFNYTGTTTQGWGLDGYNVMSFADLGSSLIIAQAVSYMSGGEVIECDIQFNTQFPFSTDPTPPSDMMDLQSIAVHELGHWLRLLDLYGDNDSSKVMYGYGSYGQVKRSLVSGDQAGIQWIYGLLDDITPPTPNPMTWAMPPYQTGTSSISMVATTATDPKMPINYYFNFAGSPTGGVGGSDSGWQSGTSYANSGLQVNHQYGYRVKARDGSNNETSYSTPVRYAYTAANSPGVASFSNVTESCVRANWAANSNPNWTMYFCEDTTTGDNSGWTTNTYWDSCGLKCGTSHSFRVKARNGDSIETIWTYLGSQSTSTCSLSIPLPPTGVQASDGVYTDRVRVNWTASALATSYTVYRGISASTHYVASLGTTAGTVYDDTTATPGVVYYYWVKASNSVGTSDFSAYDAGFRSTEIPLPPRR